MELWIRSQNKEILTQVDNVCLDEFVNYEGVDIITRIKPSDKSGILGTYKTKERALEILDEMQRKITPVTIIKQTKPIKYIDYNRTISDATLYVEDVSEVKEFGMIIYEMPEE